MKKLFLSALLAACIIVPSFAQADNTRRQWFATSLTGGGSGSLDGAISGVSINPYDIAIVIDDSKNAYLFKVKNDSAVENAPYVIAPDDVGAGTTRWHLANVYANHIDFRSGTTIPTLDYVNAGVSKFYVYSGVTLTSDMLAGGILYCHAASPIVIGIPAISGSTPVFLVKDMTGSGVTVQTTDGETMYSDDDSGTAYWVNPGHSRHSASFTVNSESGTCKYVDVIGEVGSYWLMN